MTPFPPDLEPQVRSDLVAAIRMVTVANQHILVNGIPVGEPLISPEVYQAALPDLAAALYSRWFAGSWAPASPEQSNGEAPGIVARVRAAHAGTQRLTPGWVAVSAVAGGGVVAGKDGEELSLQSGDYANLTRLAAPVRAGDSLAITARRDTAEPQDGWWLTWAAVGPAPTGHMLRIYWNAGPGAAVSLVKAITMVLADEDVPYTLKCPAEPELFGRCDSVVLYLAPEGWRASKDGLRRAHEAIATELRAPTPPLTMRLGRGVALAEDPGNGRSFGETMAWAVADGVLAALAEGLVDIDEIAATVTARLSIHGIRPTQPYLRSSSPLGLVNPW